MIMKQMWFAIGFALVLLPFSTAGTRSVSPPSLVTLAPANEPISSSYFGMHIHPTQPANGSQGGMPWPAVAIPEWRLWDVRVTWQDIEPQRGRWLFSNLDQDLLTAEQHNAAVLLTLGMCPRWAQQSPSDKGGLTAAPNIDAWRDYVQTLATRYKGRISSYEIWNEPNLAHYWSGDMDQLVALTRQAAAIIHTVDPEALIVSPPFTENSGLDYLAGFLQKGGGQYVDVIGYHFYVAPMPPEAMVPLVEAVRKIMAANGAAGKPLWNTETGWSRPKPFPSEGLAAAYLARAYILDWAAGAQRLYWYGWGNDTGWVSIGTVEADNRTLTPAGEAFGVMQGWLTGAVMSQCREDTNHLWICSLTRHAAREWIVWSPDGDTSLSIPPAWHITFVTSLLSGPSPFHGTSMTVGPSPQLLGGN